MNIHSALQDLETKGFVVVPKFLNKTELDYFKLDYEYQKIQENQPRNNYNLVQANLEGNSEVIKKLAVLCEKIKSTTSLKIDTITKRIWYYNNQHSARSYYHQDHESYYILQQSYNYLNFWIPIIKPDPEKSGLIVIPMDKLANLIPNDVHRVINHGACSYTPNGNVTDVTDDNNDDAYTLPCNITTIEECPQLEAGDALILRGDLIHSTQDCATKRLAISVRCTDGDGLIYKDRFLAGGKVKKELMATLPYITEYLLQRFDECNSDIITVNQCVFGKDSAKPTVNDKK